MRFPDKKALSRKSSPVCIEPSRKIPPSKRQPDERHNSQTLSSRMDLSTANSGRPNEPRSTGALQWSQPDGFGAPASNDSCHDSTENSLSITEHQWQDVHSENLRILNENTHLQTLEGAASQPQPLGGIYPGGGFPTARLTPSLPNNNWNFSLTDFSDTSFLITGQAMSYESGMPTSGFGKLGETTPSFHGPQIKARTNFIVPTFSIPKNHPNRASRTSYAMHEPGSGMHSNQGNSRRRPLSLPNLLDDGKIKKQPTRGKRSFAKALHLLELLKEELELCPRLTLPISRLEESIGEELLRKTRSAQSSLPTAVDSCDLESCSSYSAIYSHTSTDPTSVSSSCDFDFQAQDENSVSDMSICHSHVDDFDMEIGMYTETPRAYPIEKTVYQCTFIAANGELCSFSTKTKCDWIKHQEAEKHYPQKRYICLHCVGAIQNGHPLCVFCAEQLPATGPTKAHYLQCEKAKKKGKHIFAANRDDHSKNHLWNRHQIINIGAEESTWTFDVHGGWPRWCGFCPEQFHTWQERINAIALHFEQGMDISSWKDPTQKPKDPRDNWPGVGYRKEDDGDEDEDGRPDHGKGNGKKIRLSDNSYSSSSQSSSDTAQTSEGWTGWMHNENFDTEQQQLTNYKEEKMELSPEAQIKTFHIYRWNPDEPSSKPRMQTYTNLCILPQPAAEKSQQTSNLLNRDHPDESETTFSISEKTKSSRSGRSPKNKRVEGAYPNRNLIAPCKYELERHCKAMHESKVHIPCSVSLVDHSDQNLLCLIFAIFAIFLRPHPIILTPLSELYQITM